MDRLAPPGMELIESLEREPPTRQFQCGFCDKRFGSKPYLQKHYRIHTNDRRHLCMTPGCGKRFLDITALKAHVRTHTGEKPFQCEYAGCERRFASVSNLRSHGRTHTRKLLNELLRNSRANGPYRKDAMVVKDQHLSHQRGLFSNGSLDNGTSEPISGECPSTLGNVWASNETSQTRNSSTTGFEQQMSNFDAVESLHCQQSLPDHHESHEFYAPKPQLHQEPTQQQQQQQQHQQPPQQSPPHQLHGLPMIQITLTFHPQPFHPSGQENSAVAMDNHTRHFPWIRTSHVIPSAVEPDSAVTQSLCMTGHCHQNATFAAPNGQQVIVNLTIPGQATPSLAQGLDLEPPSQTLPFEEWLQEA